MIAVVQEQYKDLTISEHIKKLALTYVGYVFAGYLGLVFSPVGGLGVYVSPASGVSLASLLLIGRRYWPAIWLGSFSLNVVSGIPFATALGIATGNTLEALVAAVFLNRLCKFKNDFGRLHDALSFIFTGIAVVFLIGALLGTMSLWLSSWIEKKDFLLVYTTWSMGGVLGNIILAPLIMIWSKRLGAKFEYVKILEASVMSVLMVFLCYRIFGKSYDWGIYNLIMPLVLFPTIIWSALRFGQTGAVTSTFGIALFSVYWTSLGLGAFIQGDFYDNYYLLSSFLVIYSTMGLIVSSITSERSQANQSVKSKKLELLQSQSQMDIILKGITDGIIVSDKYGKFLYANKKIAEICGFASVEELLKTSIMQLMKRVEVLNEKGEKISFRQLPSIQAIEGVDDPSERLVRIRLKSTRSEKWVLFKSSPVFDEKSNAYLAVSIFKDFTSRKKDENRVKFLDEVNRVVSSSLEYKKTLNRVAELIVPKIADCCVIDIIDTRTNSSKRISFKLAPEIEKKINLVPSKIGHDSWVDILDTQHVLKFGESKLYKDLSTVYLKNITDKKAELEWMTQVGLKSALVVPLTSRGAIFGAMTLCRTYYVDGFSVEDLKFAEELARRCGVAIDNALLFTEVQEQRNQYQLAHLEMEKLATSEAAANHVKSLFLANMSHEIRTPLGAILGFVDLFNHSDLSLEEKKQYSEVIARNGKQLTQLIDDILDISKVEAGHLETETIQVSLFSLLDDVSNLMGVRAQEKGLKFSMERSADLPEFIYSDPTRLRQILINIVGNAIKFTIRGEVKVKVYAEPILSNNTQQIFFHVIDTGVGVSTEKQNRLFEWFMQADASMSRKFGGTGLGLALSRKLARLLDGDIELFQSSANGTEFIIRILNNLTLKPSVNQQLLSKVSHDNKSHSLNGVKVLLVEDSPDNRMLIETVLKRKGIIVDTAVNGCQGANKALAGDYDVVLMDIQMPVCDGLQATHKLRREGYNKPIVALTAHAMKEEQEKTLAAGCNTHLTKPVEFKKLLSAIERYSRPRYEC